MKTITHQIIIKPCLFLMVFLIQSFVFSQTQPFYIDSDSGESNSLSISADVTLSKDVLADCTANDFTLANLYLADENGNPLANTCTPGTTQSAFIYVKFAANTNANRYSLFLDYDVYVNGEEGEHRSACLYEKQAIPVGQNLRLQEINWTCGDRIELKNFYMAWQSTSNASCGTNPAKCYQNPPGFVVNAPLIANFTSASNCDSYVVQLTSTTTGGDINNPYTYKWDINNDGSVEYTTANPSHNFGVPGTYQVKLQVTDAVGKVDSQIHAITVNPILQNLTLTSSIIACSGGNTGEILASGVTGGVGNYTYSISPKPSGYVQNGAQFTNLPAGSYTVTVSDENNCTISADTTISVAESTTPSITAPANFTVEGCTTAEIKNNGSTALSFSTTPVNITTTEFTAEGGTFTESNVSITYQDAQFGTCPIVITRTFTITNDCGNSASATQTINIADTIAPVFAALPSPSTIECGATPNFAQATATDACGGEVNLTFVDVTTPGSCDGTYAITRTWTATDACGNASTASQTININDTTAPVFASLPAPSTIECGATPNFAQATATDACGGEVTLTYEDTTTPGSCEGAYAITRTWTATDACGNASTASQTININDTTAPVFAALPAPSIIECGATPNFTQASATDACGDEVNLTFVDVTTTGSCDGTYAITRTWTATDACGNASTASQTININDTTAPVFAALPAPSTIECGATPNFAQATATDACGGEVSLSYEDITTPGSCDGTYAITRTWTAIDACGNASTASQTININDTTAPVFAALPAPSTIECGATPNFAQASALDACGGEVTLTYEDTTSPGSCEGAYAITRTWTATDACGNASTASQTININDTTAPVFAALPDETTIDCEQTPSFVQATATDACDSDITLTFEDVTTPGLCEGAYTITRTWTATDNCGNASTAAQIINVQDITAPVFAALPNESTIECSETPSFAQATAVDACGSSVTLTFKDVTTDGACSGAYTVTRTWTAIDTCGNASTASQVINVMDTTGPTITTLASDLVVECDGNGNNGAFDAWLNSNGGAVASDGCSTNLTWSNNYDGSTSDCSKPVIVTFTVTDECGNTSTTTGSYSIMDSNPPVITAASDVTVESDGKGNIQDLQNWLDTNGGATATDDCSAISWSNNFTSLSDLCGPTGAATVTFTATDGCGNASSTTATFTIIDTIVPVISPLPDVTTIECTETPNFAPVTAIDSCGSPVTLSFIDTTTQGECDNTYSITRTWTATDFCGNTATASQTINVQDTTAPVFEPLPAESTIDCDATPSFAQASATDACGSEVTLTFEDTTTAGNCENTYSVTRIWTAIDTCGNVATASQTINVQDTTAPVISALPAESTIECGATPNFAEATATDSCGSEVSLTFEDTTTAGECEGAYSITRTWTATDACGNASTASQTINVQDTTAPVISALPAESTIECGATPAFAQAIATDACGSEVSLTFEEVTTPGSTEGVSAITRTWTAVDACGNVSTASQTINVQDNTAPVFAELPADSTIECGATPNFAEATATDVCSTEVTLSFEDITTAGECEGTYAITRIWTATDAYGNASTASQTINVQDTTPPVFAALPAETTVDCDVTPSFAEASATDTCGSEVTLTFEDTTTAGECEGAYSITRTWTATDACGNASTASQTIHVQDTTPPVFAALPAETTVDCDVTPSFAEASATDSCGSEVTLTFEDTTTAGECEGAYSITRTWTATDACGNASTASQTINVQDTTPPVFAALPAETTVDCDVTPSFAEASATDTCGSEVTLTFEDTTTAGECEGAYSITRTWTATDACGNASTASQTINVQDTTPPVFTALPAETTVNCDVTPSFAEASATDTCGSEVTLTFEDITTAGECEGAYSITRTWTATDACGNASTASQTINVLDTTPPSLVTEYDSELTIACDNIPTAPELVFEDACSSNINVVFTETSTASESSPDYVITRTWTATDTCENEAVYNQIINVNPANVITTTDTELCNGDDINFDLFELLSGSYDTNGQWTVVTGNASLDGSLFNPYQLELGTYSFMYSLSDEFCTTETVVNITLNDDCVVLPCGAEDVIISKAVTTYADGKNDFFTVTGVESCGFTVELQIFNRWGALIYESKNYQNDWNGASSKASIGNSNYVPTGTYYYIVNLKNSGLQPFAGPIYVATK
ncbi:gliding motility-associated-like protein [Gelidibacter sediminis]|uniref:Gliding motility-associated-like protein n=1 Tax=Gelidibacter sediminis TaxID=1608710 RepID=A0A4R7Q0U6_9FLAO|nr:gliding motility-associated C-terminal domain-containing protein [Gelidibacter sediminis]TDU40219.1 gliding motility-associated-like protein [Gelidibacter sediminis]